jgi:DNA-directed RNA polymerase specialized sigma24 family protein
MRIAIAALSDDQRDAICQHCFEHRPIEDIAAATGRTEGAVRGLIQRGKQKLAQAMGRSSRWLSSR